MSAGATRLGLVCAILVLFLVLGLVLIPVLDAELRRATAKKTADLAKLAEREQRKDRLA